jgi:integrase/recombinase XerD
VTALAPALEAFFTDRLIRQRHASPQTVAAYRDTRPLLLAFTARAGKQPSQLDIGDLDPPLIGDFPDHLKRDRGNSPRTRNARLAAIHSMSNYAALQHPEHVQLIARVLAIPPKRFDKALVTWLTEPELAALLAPPPHQFAARRSPSARECHQPVTLRCRFSGGRQQTRPGKHGPQEHRSRRVLVAGGPHG